MALFFAALLWLVVVNIDDPEEIQVYRNIPVQVVNDDKVVINTGKTYQIIDDTEAVNVTIRAKRSVLNKIKADSIVATADFNDMQLASLIPITVTVTGREGEYTSATANPNNLRVNIEDVSDNTFPLTVSTTGTVRDGYMLGEMTTNPKSIKIGGSESLINQIDRAVARIGVSGMSETATVDAELILYDIDGNVIDQTLLTNNLGDKGLSVDVQILRIKSIPITATASGTPGDGYALTSITCEPQNIQVAGTSEDLEEMEEISIAPSQLDITGLTEKQEFVIDISGYLPEGVSLVDNSANNVMVTVLIDANGAKTVELPVKSITVSNLADNLKIEYQTTDNLQLQFRGDQSLLENFNIRNAAFIDLKEYTEAGEYDVPVTIETPTGVTLESSPTVKITLSEKE